MMQRLRAGIPSRLFGRRGSSMRRKPGKKPLRHKGQRGVTLTELMIAGVIMSVGVLGLIGSFGVVRQVIQYTKSRTLATNLAQEKMQILKQQSYYKVLVSTAIQSRTDFNPTIPYESSYFPPENILEGGVRFERLTYIQAAKEDSGSVVPLPAGTPDTGMKLLTVSIIWNQQTGPKVSQLTSVLSNPDAM